MLPSVTTTRPHPVCHIQLQAVLYLCCHPEITLEESLVSFHAISQLTSVASSLAIQVAKQGLEADTCLTKKSSRTITDIVILLEFFLDATYLAFRESFYRQIQGTAMGSSVTVANLVIEDVEQKALATNSNPPKF